MFKVGVASEAFRGYSEFLPKQSWCFQDDAMHPNGQLQGNWLDPNHFDAGDVVTVELERAPGVGGVLRLRVAGKMPRELRGLPSDGVLYPIVDLMSSKQSITIVALP